MNRNAELLGQAVSLAMELSHGGYVLCRFSKSQQEYRVNVRRPGTEHIGTSQESLLLAMGRAVAWLQRTRDSQTSSV